MHKDKKQMLSNIFPYLITAIFLILSILLIINHEIWADEMRAWDISSSSEGFKQLIGYLRDSEGHPYLWYVLLYFISHFIVGNPESMKVLHLTFSAATVFLILKYAPFNKISKTMLVFSYFFFYEYSIISRNYAISILFIIIFCILYKEKYKNLIPISIVLFIAGLGNVYAFIISIILFLFLFFEIILERHNIKNGLNKIHVLIAFMVMVSSVACFYWQLGSQFNGTAISPSVSLIIKNIFFGEFFKIIKIIPEYVIKSYLPISNFNLHFWETNIIVTFLSNVNVIFVYLLGGILFLVPMLFLKKKVLFIYILGNLSIAIVQVTVWGGFLRHIGHHFIILIICIWISYLKKEENCLITGLEKFSKKLINWFLIICLGFSLVGSITAYYYDYRYPFSSAKEAADYIKSEYDLNKIIVIGYKSHPSETIAGYLNKNLYYPYSVEENKFSKFISWPKMQVVYDINLPIQSSYNFILEGKESLLIITDASKSDEDILKNSGFKKIEKDFSNKIVSWENFNLYKLGKDVEIVSLLNTSSNFEKNWKNFNNCKNQVLDKNLLFIKALNDDPSFESNFQIPKVNSKSKLFIEIEITVESGCDLIVYYKRSNSQYNEKDSSKKTLYGGSNIISIAVEDLNNLDGIRIDPVNVKQDCTINNIEFYQIIKK
jgi:hypothetical protein